MVISDPIVVPAANPPLQLPALDNPARALVPSYSQLRCLDYQPQLRLAEISMPLLQPWAISPRVRPPELRLIIIILPGFGPGDPFFSP
jgi:hypothetical protein